MAKSENSNFYSLAETKIYVGIWISLNVLFNYKSATFTTKLTYRIPNNQIQAM